MVIIKLLVVVFIGVFVGNVMPTFNPMLTYTIRYKNMSIKPNFTGNFLIDQYRDEQLINGQVKINSKQLIDTVTTIIYRCNPEGINCEYFQSWTLTDICPKLLDRNQVWSRWYGSFDPPLVCPLDKINYRIKNATIDFGYVIRMYPEATDYYWKVTQKMYSGDILIGSFIVEGSLFGYRKKTKPILSGVGTIFYDLGQNIKNLSTIIHS